MKKIYVAGPMRGKPGCNMEAFDLAEARWVAAGWQVMSPAALVRCLGYGTGDAFHNADRAHLNHVFQIDFACLFASDAIALLPGWEHSMGATAELALAQVLSLEVYDAVTMDKLCVEAKPYRAVPKLRLPVPTVNRPPKSHEDIGYSSPEKE